MDLRFRRETSRDDYGAEAGPQLRLGWSGRQDAVSLRPKRALSHSIAGGRSTSVKLSRQEMNHSDAALGREWLVTNGLGGFASGTVALANTRRYHGLLVASLRPPVDRVLMVAKLDVTARYRGARFELGTNEFADGTLAPRGFEAMIAFHLEGTMPV